MACAAVPPQSPRRPPACLSRPLPSTSTFGVALGVRLLDALSQAPGGLHRALATASSTPRRPRSWPVLAVLKFKSIYTLSNNTYVQRSSRASSASRRTRGSGTGSTRLGWSSRSPSSSLRSLSGSGPDSGVMAVLAASGSSALPDPLA